MSNIAPMPIPDKSFWGLNIARVIEKYGSDVVYMGYWSKKITKESGSYWSDDPVDVFYQPNPDTSKGHTHYFGFFKNWATSTFYVTNAESCFSEPINVAVKDDKLIVSRYRHDFNGLDQFHIDGGRDYVRYVGDPAGWEFKLVTVDGPNFIWYNEDEMKEAAE